MAYAVRDGSEKYVLSPTANVGDGSSLLVRLRRQQDTCVLVGFDFPIGLPAAYSRRIRLPSFEAGLRVFGGPGWEDFYAVADCQAEISVRRPFYPRASKRGVEREHLTTALGVESFDALRRRCELATASRRAACPLFWTLGGNQVGKAALTGWLEVIAPAHREHTASLWPFDGSLAELLEPGRTVIAETYPADVYPRIGIDLRLGAQRGRSGKRVQSCRAANAPAVEAWTEAAGVELTTELRDELRSGFGPAPDGDDRFDAVVGLVGMLDVVLGRRASGEPKSDVIRQLEGWILGLDDGSVSTSARTRRSKAQGGRLSR
jgi:hypothetical protein